MSTGDKRKHAYGDESPAIRQNVAWLATSLPLVTKRLGWEVTTEPLNGGLMVTFAVPSGTKYDFRVSMSAEGEGTYCRIRHRGDLGAQGDPIYPKSGGEAVAVLVGLVARWEAAAVTGEA